MPGQPRHQWNSGVALGDDGVVIAGHCSSSHGWCKHDMMAEWKHDLYDAHFGEGNWELVWIDDVKHPNDSGFDEAIKLAKKLDAEGKQQDKRARVTLEMTDGSTIEKKF